MTDFTITNPDLKFKKTVTTSVLSVVENDTSLSVVLDAYPDTTVVIGGVSQNHGLKEGKEVTLSYISKDTYRFSYTGTKASSPSGTKGSSPAAGFRPTTELS